MRVLPSYMNIMHIKNNRLKESEPEITTNKTEDCILRGAIFKQRILYIVDRSNLVTLPLFFSFCCSE